MNRTDYSRRFKVCVAAVGVLLAANLLLMLVSLGDVEDDHRTSRRATERVQAVGRLERALSANVASARAYLLTGDEHYLTDLDLERRAFQDVLGKLKRVRNTPAATALLGELETAAAEHHDKLTAAILAHATTDTTRGDSLRIFRDEVQPQQQVVDRALRSLVTELTQRSDTAARGERAAIRTTRARVLGVGALGAVVVVVGAFIVRGFGRASRRMTAQMQETERQAQAYVTSELRLREANETLSLIGEMSDLVQTSNSTDEAYRIIARQFGHLFPDLTGSVCIVRDGLAETLVAFGDMPGAEPAFAVSECWALRRGRHHLGDTSRSVTCGHLAADRAVKTLCVPMMSHGETIGVISVLSEDFTPAQRQVVGIVAERMALSLANLRLRETLAVQAIRDPLTGLFNRRYLDETLQRELRRAKRRGESIGVISMDVDHFKKVNDTRGHEGGDAVLRALGELLRAKTRAEDVACRLGGEELVVILVGSTLEATRAKAELLRADLKRQKNALEGITVSFGVSAGPEHGWDAKDLLRASDAALYRAKHGGRDRVEVAPVEATTSEPKEVAA